MKNKLLLLVLLFRLAAMSQMNYTVFKTSSGIRYFSGMTKQWEALHPGDSISNNTKIKFDQHSILIIFDAKFHIYEVKRVGEYLLKNTINLEGHTTSMEMQNAVKFFIEQTFEANANSNKQKVKGAIYRGEERIFPWDSTVIIEDTFTVSIRLPKGNYPVLVSLNDYRVLIYNDTNLHLSHKYFKSKESNELVIGKSVVHLKNKQDKNEVQQMITIIHSEELPSSTKYALLIDYCITKKYYTLAKSYIDLLRNEDKASYDAVIESLNGNELFNKLVKL